MAGKEMTSTWLLIIGLGVATFLIRLSFIWLFKHWQPPTWLTKALRFVPIAVLTAIAIPELILPGGEWMVPYTNPRLIAGIVAILVAWFTRNVLATIAAGMVILFVASAFM
jgi:branched-subunit amino acid transport protein